MKLTGMNEAQRKALTDKVAGRKIDLVLIGNQKPVKLYQWIFKNYSSPGQKILDTHLGSGSSAIAAHYFGVDFVGCELDEYYYGEARKRLEIETKQISIF